MRVESPGRLNDHRAKSVEALGRDVMAEVHRHRRSVWLTRRSSHVRVGCVAQTVLQKLVHFIRCRSNGRLSQKLCSDTAVGLSDVDRHRVRGADGSGCANAGYREYAAHGSNETEISHSRVSWQTRWMYYEMGLLASSIG